MSPDTKKLVVMEHLLAEFLRIGAEYGYTAETMIGGLVADALTDFRKEMEQRWKILPNGKETT